MAAARTDATVAVAVKAMAGAMAEATVAVSVVATVVAMAALRAEPEASVAVAVEEMPAAVEEMPAASGGDVEATAEATVAVTVI